MMALRTTDRFPNLLGRSFAPRDLYSFAGLRIHNLGASTRERPV